MRNILTLLQFEKDIQNVVATTSRIAERNNDCAPAGQVDAPPHLVVIVIAIQTRDSGFYI